MSAVWIGLLGADPGLYAETVNLLPVIAMCLLDGRAGSTLLLQLLATSEEVTLEPTTSCPNGLDGVAGVGTNATG